MKKGSEADSFGLTSIWSGLLAPFSNYILTNPSLNYLKIGKTIRIPQYRARELTRRLSRKPAWIGEARYEVAYEVFVSNCDKVEKMIHKKLRLYRISEKEFFEIALEKAIEEISGIIDKYKIELD
jgi:hypothetical protein